MEIPKTLQSTWAKVSKDNNITSNDYDLLLNAAAPIGSKEEIAFLSYVSSKILNSQEKGISTSEISMKIPKTLKATWDEVRKNKFISPDDLEKLLKAASPAGQKFGTEEYSFLHQVNSKLYDSKAKGVALSEFSFVDDSSDNTLDWSGYSKEAVDEFKLTFKDKEMVFDKGIPHLTKAEGDKIAAIFDKSSVEELQKLVNANVDGLFGPETMYKSFDYVTEKIVNFLNHQGEKITDAEREKFNKMLVFAYGK